MTGYGCDRAWSDGFIPELRRIIGPHLLVPSTLEQDTREAADLVILRGRDLTIACRVRRPGYLEKKQYGREFTIRRHRDSGAKTEMAKIIEGWGDWMFYGHSSDDERQIRAWWLIDLHHFRAHLIRNRGLVLPKKVPNGDGTYFNAFRVDSFPPEPPLLVAASDPPPSSYVEGRCCLTPLSLTAGATA